VNEASPLDNASPRPAAPTSAHNVSNPSVPHAIEAG
jgi:hypothetical protein